MPIYGFTCDACGHQFDRLQKIADPDPTTCPECGQESVRRQVTAPSFRLAGSGWYETDFKGKGDKQRNLASKDDGGKSSAESGSSSSSESSKKSDGSSSASTASSND